jgi:hypothetical protein
MTSPDATPAAAAIETLRGIAIDGWIPGRSLRNAVLEALVTLEAEIRALEERCKAHWETLAEIADPLSVPLRNDSERAVAAFQALARAALATSQEQAKERE